MELLESVERINKRLRERYGIFTTGEPNWRVVFSEDQYEKRLTWHTPEGFELLTPKVIELPKYKQWIHQKYILERLLPVPLPNQNELTTKTSYEPVWVFEDKQGNPLPPKWEAIEVIIHTVYQQSAMAVGAKYVDPDKDPKESIERREERLAKLQEDLFGNETTVGDALAHKSAIVVPSGDKIQ